MKRITFILFVVFLFLFLIWFHTDSIQRPFIKEAFGGSSIYYLKYATGDRIILKNEFKNNPDLNFKPVERNLDNAYDEIILITPENNSTVTVTSPLLQWFTSDTSVVFNIWLGLSNDTLNLIAEQIKDQQIQTEDMFDLSSYSWRVDMINSDTIITGETWTFFVQKEMPLFFKDLLEKQMYSVDTIIWKNFGPGMAGYCEEFFIHPTDPNTILMNPDMGNAYCTNDNAISWTTIKKWDEDGESRNPVWIDFSRQDQA